MVDLNKKLLELVEMLTSCGTIKQSSTGYIIARDPQLGLDIDLDKRDSKLFDLLRGQLSGRPGFQVEQDSIEITQPDVVAALKNTRNNELAAILTSVLLMGQLKIVGDQLVIHGSSYTKHPNAFERTVKQLSGYDGVAIDRGGGETIEKDKIIIANPEVIAEIKQYNEQFHVREMESLVRDLMVANMAPKTGKVEVKLGSGLQKLEEHALELIDMGIEGIGKAGNEITITNTRIINALANEGKIVFEAAVLPS